MSERRPYSRRYWTEAEITNLQALYAAGTPMRKLCTLLGRSRCSVKSKVINLGMGGDRRKPWKMQDVERLRSAVLAGATFESIAKMLGRGKRPCQQRAQAMGLLRCQRHWWTDGQDSIIRRSTDALIYDLARRFRVPENAIAIRVRKFTLTHARRRRRIDLAEIA